MKPKKPLGMKSYGSIPHLPGSKTGPKDYCLDDAAAYRVLNKTKEKHDKIQVTEKIDGSNVGVLKLNDKLIPLNRAGYNCQDAPRAIHRTFAKWAYDNYDKFDDLLNEGERACGEWLGMVHGTFYDLTNRDPFVIFDIITNHKRDHCQLLRERVNSAGLTNVPLIHFGDPKGLSELLYILNDNGYYGAKNKAEGLVFKTERNKKIVNLCKYVRPEKEPGKYISLGYFNYR
jgi:ATP-dependent RNA circularization protein (DNA/RNA ligase family)